MLDARVEGAGGGDQVAGLAGGGDGEGGAGEGGLQEGAEVGRGWVVG